MPLSIDLISQFAKITKDKETEKKEVTAYGTIAEYAGRKCVKLDGSDLYTPVMTTVEAVEDERVIVSLKNHTATVIGNITSPAVRTETVRVIVDNVTGLEKVLDDTASTSDLAAIETRVDALETADTNITQTLANKLDSSVAASTYAPKTSIDALNEAVSKKLDSDIAANTYALKSTINALNATIEALEARVQALEGGA
jgi:hypothetical protein